jgi:hypothetical protein
LAEPSRGHQTLDHDPRAGRANRRAAPTDDDTWS